MLDVVVVASHLPDEGYFQSRRYVVDPVECRDDYDYWNGLNARWDTPTTIINIEHDIEATDEHIDALLACSHAACSFGYECHWITTHLGHDIIAAGAGNRDDPARPLVYYLKRGEEWATWSAIGLVKITPEARIAPLRKEPWSRLELAVENAVARPWHMHWDVDAAGLPVGVPHHHW